MLSTAPPPPGPILRYECSTPATFRSRPTPRRSFSSTSTGSDAPVLRCPVQAGALDGTHPWLSVRGEHWILSLALALTGCDRAAAVRAWYGLSQSLYSVEVRGDLVSRPGGGELLLHTTGRRVRSALADTIEGLSRSNAWLALCATGARFTRLAVLPSTSPPTSPDEPVSSQEGSAPRPRLAPLVIAVEVADGAKQAGWSMSLNEFLATASDDDLDALLAWDLHPRCLDAGAVGTLWSTFRTLRTAGDERGVEELAGSIRARATPVSSPHRGPRAELWPTPYATPHRPVATTRRLTSSGPSGSERRSGELTRTPSPVDHRRADKALRVEKKRAKVSAWLEGVESLDEARPKMDDDEENEKRVPVGSADEEVEERDCTLVFVTSDTFGEIINRRLA